MVWWYFIFYTVTAFSAPAPHITIRDKMVYGPYESQVACNKARDNTPAPSPTVGKTACTSITIP